MVCLVFVVLLDRDHFWTFPGAMFMVPGLSPALFASWDMGSL